MKLIHLSDLHLGVRVNEFSMIDEQKYILQQILQIIDREEPDGVLIAGDVYDKTVPSAEAVALFDSFLSALSDREIPVFVISGNHDSPERIAFGASIMGRGGVHLSPVYHGHVESVLLTGRDGVTAQIYMLPFVKPAHVRPYFPELEIGDYTDAVRAAVEEMTEQRSQGAEALSEGERAEKSWKILVAHQFVTGGEQKDDSENTAVKESSDNVGNAEGDKEVAGENGVEGENKPATSSVYVGGTENVDASVFAPFDYVALGHIHRAYNVGNGRYCGTPLKYSFSEAGQEKSVTILELGERGEADIQVRTVPLHPLHDWLKIRGSYLEVSSRKFYEQFDRNAYIHVTLTDEEDVPDAAAKLMVVYPNLMKLEYDNCRTRSRQTIEGTGEPESRDPLTIFGEFYEKQNNQPMQEEQERYMQKLINEIWMD